ncbi:uncharacterized protein LOC129615411 [Condylostylus longicornis]|uniref:uncharacterized protein LOC129615411 n=1 Tax=Condylostylus longicornis TaxID=2530218 RepID=UPI00244D99D5|nr:uncharacterized protein LOC129615411 [Condylostylus longicornis]
MSFARYEVATTSGNSTNSERFTYEEIIFLLDLCEKHCIINQSQTKGYNLVRAFTPIQHEMLDGGYNRSLTQIIDKFRKLKLRFVHSYLARKKGKPAMANRFEHYKRFEKLLENAKVDIDTFIKKFSKKNSKISEDDMDYENIKDESNSNNAFDQENCDDFEQITMDDNDIIEKEILINDDFQNDDTEDYLTENMDIKILPHFQTSSSSSYIPRNNDTRGLSLSERTVILLEQLVPSFKKAQEELQAEFFRQQKELIRQQQEWEERILDEEREYFTKVLARYNTNSQD